MFRIPRLWERGGASTVVFIQLLISRTTPMSFVSSTNVLGTSITITIGHPHNIPLFITNAPRHELGQSSGQMEPKAVVTSDMPYEAAERRTGGNRVDETWCGPR